MDSGLADALTKDGRYLAEHYSVYGILPMVFRDAPVVLLMSGRAGSSFAVKWFLHHNPVASDFVWAHRIRVDTVYPSPWHRQRVREVIDGERVSLVRFTRDPYHRSVSAYLHSLRQARPRQAIADQLGLGLDAPYSFAEYLGALEALLPTASCDEHAFPQRTLLDTLQPIDHVYRVEDGVDRLREIEMALDLPPTPDDDYRALRRTNHDADYLASTTFMGRTPLTPGRDAQRQVQRSNTFYDDDLVRQVNRLYAEDFDRFDYPRRPAGEAGT